MKIGGSLAWNESMGIMLRPLFIALLVLAVPCEDDDKQDKATGVQVEQEDDNDSDGGPEEQVLVAFSNFLGRWAGSSPVTYDGTDYVADITVDLTSNPAGIDFSLVDTKIYTVPSHTLYEQLSCLGSVENWDAATRTFSRFCSDWNPKQFSYQITFDSSSSGLMTMDTAVIGAFSVSIFKAPE